MLVTLILICLFLPQPGLAAQTGSAAPVFALTDIAGNSVRSSDYRGKVVLVNFWSPWCIPCREELSALDGLYTTYRKDGFEVIAISVEQSQKAASAIVRAIHITFPVLLDVKKKVSDDYQCSHLPTTVIIGRDGVVRKVVKGFGKEYIREYENTIIELVKQTNY